MNKALLIGRVGHDPESRNTNSGSAVANFSIATHEKYDGKEKTEWHKVVAFGKTAELALQYLKKGNQCLIEGKIHTRQYEDKTGKKAYTTEIVASSIQFLDSPKGEVLVPEPAEESFFG
jgi:single-strand DNA-binding protein